MKFAWHNIFIDFILQVISLHDIFTDWTLFLYISVIKSIFSARNVYWLSLTVKIAKQIHAVNNITKFIIWAWLLMTLVLWIMGLMVYRYERVHSFRSQHIRWHVGVWTHALTSFSGHQMACWYVNPSIYFILRLPDGKLVCELMHSLHSQHTRWHVGVWTHPFTLLLGHQMACWCVLSSIYFIFRPPDGMLVCELIHLLHSHGTRWHVGVWTHELTSF